jgi:hypothetical protein
VPNLTPEEQRILDKLRKERFAEKPPLDPSEPGFSPDKWAAPLGLDDDGRPLEPPAPVPLPPAKQKP